MSCGSNDVTPPSPLFNAPSLTCPADIELVLHQGQPQPTANFDAPMPRDGEAPVNVTCTPGSGNEFPNGSTTVTCEAIDAGARKGSCTFTVIVKPVPQLVKTTFMAFGDSLTEGKEARTLVLRSGVFLPPRSPDPPVFNSPVSYVSQLYFKMTERYQDQSITIIAEGYGGRFAGEDKDRVRAELDRWKPDALFLLEGTNDMANYPDAAGIASAADALQRMVRDAKSRGVRVFLATLPPINARAPGYRNNLGGEAAVPLLNDRIRAIAASENVKLVDLYNALPMSELGNDGLHLKESGYKIMAEEWLKAVIETMEVMPTPAAPVPPTASPVLSRRGLN